MGEENKGKAVKERDSTATVPPEGYKWQHVRKGMEGILTQDSQEPDRCTESRPSTELLNTQRKEEQGCQGFTEAAEPD